MRMRFYVDIGVVMHGLVDERRYVRFHNSTDGDAGFIKGYVA